MEFGRIKIKNTLVNVVYNNNIYVFHNEWYGIVAIAVEKSTHNNEVDVYIGNHELLGNYATITNDNVLQNVKRYIKRKIGKADFNVIEKDLLFASAQLIVDF